MGKRRTLLLVVVVSGCGARTGLDVLLDASSHDATLPRVDARVDDGAVIDAQFDVTTTDAAVVTCANGYFIEVTNDAGTTILKGGCDAGVPSRTCVPAGEDCLSTAIQGCDVGGSIVLSLGECFCNALTVGTFHGQTIFADTTGVRFGIPTIDITAVGSTAATGDYDSVIVLQDGGAKTHIHGAFCVRP